MSFKKIVGKMHLWLGLTSGLLVLFLGITGCILAYQQEIENLTQDYRFAEKQEKRLLPPSKIKSIAELQLKDKHAHSVRYEDGKSAAVMFYSLDPEYYWMVYVNPYTGVVSKVKDMDADFFRIIILGHYYLWLPPNIGQPIVASATLIFVLMLISGLVLWWPKNAAAGKKRFKVKFNAKWRRLNYDLHNVLGFYITWIAIFIAATGLVMGFQWFAGSVYWVASGGESMTEYYSALSDSTVAEPIFTGNPADALWGSNIKTWQQKGGSMEVHFPDNQKESIEIAFNPETTTYWQTDYRYYDQKTLKEIPVTHMYGSFKNASGADKLIRMNYDIHVGAIAGLFGKTLAFFASLIAASMPVTGFLIWRGRKKKDKKRLYADKATRSRLETRSELKS